MAVGAFLAFPFRLFQWYNLVIAIKRNIVAPERTFSKATGSQAPKLPRLSYAHLTTLLFAYLYRTYRRNTILFPVGPRARRA
jgi:hypothetical protein